MIQEIIDKLPPTESQLIPEEMGEEESDLEKTKLPGGNTPKERAAARGRRKGRGSARKFPSKAIVNEMFSSSDEESYDPRAKARDPREAATRRPFEGGKYIDPSEAKPSRKPANTPQTPTAGKGPQKAKSPVRAKERIPSEASLCFKIA